VADEDAGDAHTLGLLVDLRNLCTRIGDEHHRMASELHDLLRQVQSPNVHGLDKEMGYRIMQLDEKGDPEGWPEMLRALSLAAFEAACKCYPTRRMILQWGSIVVDRYEPVKSK